MRPMGFGYTHTDTQRQYVFKLKVIPDYRDEKTVTVHIDAKQAADIASALMNDVETTGRCVRGQRTFTISRQEIEVCHELDDRDGEWPEDFATRNYSRMSFSGGFGPNSWQRVVTLLQQLARNAG